VLSKVTNKLEGCPTRRSNPRTRKKKRKKKKEKKKIKPRSHQGSRPLTPHFIPPFLADELQVI
jgi:hypothetical protein